MALNDIKKVIRDWYRHSVAPEVKSLTAYPYVKEFMAAAAIVLVAAIIFWGYRSYHARQEGSAQIDFAHALESYQAALRGGAISWSQLEILLQSGYAQHKNSAFAPYFLLYESEAQLKQNKMPEAAATLEKVVSLLSKDSPLLTLYKTKLALIEMDLPEASRQQAALEQLRALAYDKENKFNDYALYYLGLFIENQGQKEEAQKIWKELVESQRNEQRLAQSPWVMLAKDKLVPCGEGELKE